MAVVEIEHVSKQFVRGGIRVEAVRDVSLRIEDGQFVALVGPSGCGKSTLLHILGGFVPATAGAMRVDGRPVRGPGPDRGMMFQDLALFPWRNVAGNVGWALEVQGRPKAEREAVVDRYLDLVGLRAFKHHYPNELSGGMRQRVALARTLAFDPGVLLMDEPFGALDAQTREMMQEELQRIWEEHQKTVLLVTHDIEEAVYLANRVVVMTARPGQIKADLAIDLPHPRRIELKKDAAFIAYRNQIWDLLREEVLKARAQLQQGA
ncbi:MAG TPA: ABC transporter ATP-binding protein [Chloroflexota bacterium]|jgi:NitT/TauT family transport system ATP-binding protein|nr:ABC transporter ATP-binding protein [Chloroflexota bacterium]